MDETNIRSSLNLARIRLQLAIYFCLHTGQFAGKHCKLASTCSFPYWKSKKNSLLTPPALTRTPSLAATSVSNDAIGYAQLRRWFGNCPRHTAMAETAARPSQGRRSRNVMTMLVLC